MGILFVSTTMFAAEQSENFSGETIGNLEAKRGELLFSDDFERSEIGGEWIEHFELISLQNGVLVTKQIPDKHAAIARHEMDLQNSMIFDFDLRFVRLKVDWKSLCRTI